MRISFGDRKREQFIPMKGVREGDEAIWLAGVEDLETTSLEKPR
jgi:hypothetical protein